MSAIGLAAGAAPLTIGDFIEFVRALAIRPARPLVREANGRGKTSHRETADAARGGPSETEAGPLEGMTVLIVDDNAINIYVLQAFLAAFRPDEILSARSGEAALEILRRRTCDVIFMDIQMPGIDGVATTQAIRNCPSGRHAKTPIIAVTAACRVFGPNHAAEAGMDGYVEKPVTRESLHCEVEKAVRLAKERRGQGGAQA